MTSSIALPRRCLADCSPMHQRMASTMFDLPQPLGPTTAVMGWLKFEHRAIAERLESVDFEALDSHWPLSSSSWHMAM